MKTCTKCSGLKALTSFHKDKRHVSGYASNCKECKKLYALTHDRGAATQKLLDSYERVLPVYFSYVKNLKRGS